MAEKFGWTLEYMYDMSEMKISNIVQSLTKEKEPARDEKNGVTSRKKTANEVIAEKSKKLGRRLTSKEVQRIMSR